jgi:hypothetical protein
MEDLSEKLLEHENLDFKRIIMSFFDKHKNNPLILDEINLQEKAKGFWGEGLLKDLLKYIATKNIKIIKSIDDLIIFTENKFYVRQTHFENLNIGINYNAFKLVGNTKRYFELSSSELVLNFRFDSHWIRKPYKNSDEILLELTEIILSAKRALIKEKERLEQEQIELKKKIEKEIETERIKMLKQNQSLILSDLDKNNDGKIDLVENGFNKLLSKNQKVILEIDKNYIHKFVKISNYIKTKQQNTQKIFESIRDTSSQEELEERINLLKNQIHSYELLVFHSINMIGALLSQDLISFYEIYESFDKLGIFNSNWENEVSEKLTNIGSKLDDLMYSIYNMEQNIVSELNNLSYITQESFEDLNRSVTSQLREVESSINTNNLLTGIQAYQLYKINKNTKGLMN